MPPVIARSTALSSVGGVELDPVDRRAMHVGGHPSDLKREHRNQRRKQHCPPRALCQADDEAEPRACRHHDQRLRGGGGKPGHGQPDASPDYCGGTDGCTERSHATAPQLFQHRCRTRRRYPREMKPRCRQRNRGAAGLLEFSSDPRWVGGLREARPRSQKWKPSRFHSATNQVKATAARARIM